MDDGGTDMNAEEAGSCPSSAGTGKRKRSVRVPANDFVVDCIKTLKEMVVGMKREDNKRLCSLEGGHRACFLLL